MAGIKIIGRKPLKLIGGNGKGAFILIICPEFTYGMWKETKQNKMKW